MADCEAKIELLPSVLILCGEPGAAVRSYECPEGHRVTKANCEMHEPAPGMVFCLQCSLAGRESELTEVAEPLPGGDR